MRDSARTKVPSNSAHRLPWLRVEHVGDDLLPPSGSVPSHVWRGVGNGVLAHGYRAGDRWWMRWPGVGTFLLTPSSPAVIVVPEEDAIRGAVEDAFRRGVTPVALWQRGFEVLHASAVLTPAGVVALCAESGTGKSTLAAGLAAAGYTHWADDFVVLNVSTTPARSRHAPSRRRLEPEAARAIGRISPAFTSPADPGEDAPLAALLVVRREHHLVGPAPLTIARVTAARALTSILPHAHECSLGGPARQRSCLEAYLAIAASAPVFQVTFKPGFDSFPAVVSSLAAQLTSLVQSGSRDVAEPR